MAIRIAHASIDENGKAAGGIAGDQTGREVKVSNWYNGGWEFTARAKDPTVAEIIAATAAAGCNNPNIGYDQSSRNTLMAQAKTVNFDLSKISAPCECDCSSFVAVCVRAALGEDFYTGNAPTTRTLKNVLRGTGAFDILAVNVDNLRRGDILCKSGSHTVMVLDNSPAQGITYNVKLPLLIKGCRGESVKSLQQLLIAKGCDCGKSGADGIFGADTDDAVKRYQESHGLTVDGEVGGNTWSALLGMG